MAFPVFFDACTIYGITLSDLLLRLADEGAFRPLWSEEVLDEAFDVELVHPDAFLLDQLDLYPGMITRVLRELSEDYVDPPQSVEDVLGTLRRAGVPQFTDEVRRYF